MDAKLTVCIATLGKGLFKIELPEKVLNLKYLVIHQRYQDAGPLPAWLERSDVTYIKSDTLGLSKNRNEALSLCDTPYVYIMDDDVEVLPHRMLELIASMEVDQTDIGTCMYLCEDGTYSTRYKSYAHNHSIFSLAKVSSISICLNRKAVNSVNCRFNEHFGLGALYPSGEEYIFLTDCLKSKLRIRFYPIITAVHPVVSSGLDFYSSYEKSIAKRKMIQQVFGTLNPLILLAFWLKKLPTVVKKGHLVKFTQAFLFGKRAM